MAFGEAARRRPGRALRAGIAPSLALLLAMGALLAVAWSAVLPPLQGPDESAHIAAVTRLVEDGTPVGGTPGLPRELLVLADEGGLGPLLGNIAARPAWTPDDRRRVDRALRGLGPRRAEIVESETGPPTRGTARNPPLYTAYESVPYLAGREALLLDRLALMRLWNVPLLLVAIAACWFLAAEVLPASPRAPFVAGALVALQPQLGFMTGVVNPDILLVALTSCFCLLAVRLVRRGPAVGSIVALSAIVAAAMATHARGVVLLPCAALAIALAIPWRTMLPRERWRAGLLVAAPVAVVAALAALVAPAADVSLGGTALQTGRAFLPREFASYVWQFYLPRLPFMDAPLGGDYGIRQAGVETAWGTFASLEVQFPGWVFDAIGATLLLVAGVAVVTAVRRRPHEAVALRIAVLLTAVVVATLFALHVAAYRLLLADASDPVIVGRQLLVLIGPLGVLVAAGIDGLGRRLASPAVALLVGALVALDLAGLGLTAIRFYA